MAKYLFGRECEAPLLADRITASKPFQVALIDFAKPLYVKGTPHLENRYIALFTFATTRAVLLELCSDMTRNTFVLSFQRFIGRRCLPHIIYTDYAQTFAAANKELAKLRRSITAAMAH
jgi:hypothetical protein